MLETLKRVHEFSNKNKLFLNVDKMELIFFQDEKSWKKIFIEKKHTRKGTCQGSWSFSGLTS